MVAVVVLGLVAPRAASAEIAVLAFNASPEALELLQDADGFVVLNEGTAIFDAHPDAMRVKVYNTARLRCGRQGISAFVALDFTNHTRVISRACAGLTSQTTQSNEQEWRGVIEGWPAFVWEPGARHALWLGLVLNRAYHQVTPASCKEYVLENLLGTLRNLPAMASQLKSEPLILCSEGARPVAPLADLEIIATGFDPQLARILLDLSDRQLLLARRLARLLIVQTRSRRATVSFETVSGAWTTRCDLQAVGKARRLRVKVLATCRTASTSSAASGSVSTTVLLAKNLSGRAAATSWDVVRSFSETGRIERGVLLAAMSTATDWRVAVLHRASYKLLPRHIGTGGTVGGLTEGPAQSFLKAVRGKAEARVYYRFVEEGKQCRFWFVSAVSRVELKSQNAACRPAIQDSVGAEVYATECSCSKVIQMVEAKKWELRVTQLRGDA